MSEATYWNGKPTPCTKVWVLVGPAVIPLPREPGWPPEYEGNIRKAVRIEIGPVETLYLGDDAGLAWRFVTEPERRADWAALPPDWTVSVIREVPESSNCCWNRTS